MASIFVREFKTAQQAQFFLQGAVFMSPEIGYQSLVTGIVGKTLIFTKPAAATCTFVAGANKLDSTALTIQEIKTQLEAAIAGLKVKHYDSLFYLVQATPTFGGGVAISGGTSLPIFGFAAADTPTGTVYQATGGAPQWLGQYGGQNSHVVVTLE